MEEACAKQVKHLEAEMFLGPRTWSPKKQALYNKLKGAKQSIRHDPNTMEVDVTQMQGKPQTPNQGGQGPRLSQEKLDALRVLGGCFRCGQVGHL